MSTQTIIDNIRGFAEDGAELLRSEAKLAQHEAEQSFAELINGVIVLAAGAVVALVALIMFADAAAAWLHTYFNPAVAALIVGGFLAVVGIILLAIGRSRINIGNLMPRRTIASVRRTAADVKEAA